MIEPGTRSWRLVTHAMRVTAVFTAVCFALSAVEHAVLSVDQPRYTFGVVFCAALTAFFLSRAVKATRELATNRVEQKRSIHHH